MWVDIDEDGYVSVDGEKLEEPYVTDRSKGISDLEYPDRGLRTDACSCLAITAPPP